MTFGIIIGTKADGTKSAVGDPMPLSKAKAAFQSVETAGLKMIELFELRQHSKRRKIAAIDDPESSAVSPAKRASKAKREPKKPTQPKE